MQKVEAVKLMYLHGVELKEEIPQQELGNGTIPFMQLQNTHFRSIAIFFIVTNTYLGIYMYIYYPRFLWS